MRAGEGRPSRVVTTSHQWERDGHIARTTDGVTSSASATVQMGTAGWVQMVMDVDDGSAVEATNILSRSSIFKLIKDVTLLLTIFASEQKLILRMTSELVTTIVVGGYLWPVLLVHVNWYNAVAVSPVTRCP